MKKLMNLMFISLISVAMVLPALPADAGRDNSIEADDSAYNIKSQQIKIADMLKIIHDKSTSGNFKLKSFNKYDELYEDYRDSVDKRSKDRPEYIKYRARIGRASTKVLRETKKLRKMLKKHEKKHGVTDILSWNDFVFGTRRLTEDGHVALNFVTGTPLFRRGEDGRLFALNAKEAGQYGGISGGDSSSDDIMDEIFDEKKKKTKRSEKTGHECVGGACNQDEDSDDGWKNAAKAVGLIGGIASIALGGVSYFQGRKDRKSDLHRLQRRAAYKEARGINPYQEDQAYYWTLDRPVGRTATGLINNGLQVILGLASDNNMTSEQYAEHQKDQRRDKRMMAFMTYLASKRGRSERKSETTFEVTRRRRNNRLSALQSLMPDIEGQLGGVLKALQGAGINGEYLEQKRQESEYIKRLLVANQVETQVLGKFSELTEALMKQARELKVQARNGDRALNPGGFGIEEKFRRTSNSSSSGSSRRSLRR